MMPIIPGSPEWYARVASILAEEATQPMRWWYMSFVDPELPEGHRFLGGILIEACGPTEAMIKSRHQGINPGGEVLTIEVRAELVPNVPESMRNRLCSRAEWESLDQPGPEEEQ